MCKRRMNSLQPATPEGGYEGQTVQLDERIVERVQQSRSCTRFPWWTLWLIWPLMALIGWMTERMQGLTTAVWHVFSQPMMLQVNLLPILLIGAGVIILLLARRNRGE